MSFLGSVVSDQQVRSDKLSDSLSEPPRPGRQCVANVSETAGCTACECLARVDSSVDIGPTTQLSAMVREPPEDGVREQYSEFPREYATTESKVAMNIGPTHVCSSDSVDVLTGDCVREEKVATKGGVQKLNKEGRGASAGSITGGVWNEGVCKKCNGALQFVAWKKSISVRSSSGTFVWRCHQCSWVLPSNLGSGQPVTSKGVGDLGVKQCRSDVLGSPLTWD